MAVLHEVKEEYVIEETVHLFLIFEVDAVVQLGKLEDNLDSLRLVGATETSVGLPAENSLTALEDEMRTDRVFVIVELFWEWFLLR